MTRGGVRSGRRCRGRAVDPAGRSRSASWYWDWSLAHSGMDRPPFEHLDRPVRQPEERRRMAGAGVPNPLTGRVVLGEEQRGHVRVGQRAEVPVEALEHRRRRESVERAVLQDVAQLAHRRRGPNSVADDVADDEHHPAVAQRHRVVPVAADLQADATGYIARREVRILQDRQAVRGAGCVAAPPQSPARARTASRLRPQARPAPRSPGPARCLPRRSAGPCPRSRTGARRAARSSARRGTTSAERNANAGFAGLPDGSSNTAISGATSLTNTGSRLRKARAIGPASSFGSGGHSAQASRSIVTSSPAPSRSTTFPAVTAKPSGPARYATQASANVGSTTPVTASSRARVSRPTVSSSLTSASRSSRALARAGLRR